MPFSLKRLAIQSSFSMALLLSISLSTVQAAVPTEASVKKLMKVTNVDGIIKSMPKQGAAVVDEVMMGMVLRQNVKQLSDAQRQQLNAVSKKYVQKLITKVDTPATQQALINNFIKITQKHYTQAEVDAQIKFYGSAVGQSIIKKQPILMHEFTEIAVPTVLKSTQSNMKKLIPELEKEVKSAVK